MSCKLQYTFVMQCFGSMLLFPLFILFIIDNVYLDYTSVWFRIYHHDNIPSLVSPHHHTYKISKTLNWVGQKVWNFKTWRVCLLSKFSVFISTNKHKRVKKSNILITFLFYNFWIALFFEHEFFQICLPLYSFTIITTSVLYLLVNNLK